MQHLTQLKPLNRFTQVPNVAMDMLPDLNSIGLLTIVLRHTAEWHFTLDALVAEKRRIPGATLSRKTAYDAMKTLIAFGWVCKVKFSDGGGHRHTAVFRTVEPFTDDDYAQICQMYRQGTELWVYCSSCDEDEAVLTQVRGTALITWARGKDRPLPEVFAQVAPTVTNPTVGGPAAGGPTVGEPAAGNVTAYKKTSQHTSQKTGEGEEDARARVSEPPVDNPTEWGIAPRACQDPGGSSLFCRVVIDDVAAVTGMGLSPDHHRRLVTELMPVALEAVAQLGDENITGAELAEWLKTRHQTTESLYAVLATRLDPDYLSKHLPAWVAGRGGRTPSSQPGPDRPSQEPPAAPEPRPKGRRCPTHRVFMVADASGHGWTCLDCERDEPAPRPAPAPAPPPAPWQEPPEPEVPDHCGQCHEFSRHLVRYDELRQEHMDLGPCSTCHPTTGLCPRCHPDEAAPGAA